MISCGKRSVPGKDEPPVYLFFDTETSDLPRSWKAPASDVDNWPRIVQLAWVVCDAGGNTTGSQVRLVQPVGFDIAPGAIRTHGISTEFARDNGEPLVPVLHDFAADVRAADVLVAHNMDFDEKIVAAEYIRAGLENPMEGKVLRCTMRGSTEFCRLPGNYGYKWPQLSELYSVLFGQPFDGAHDAGADCRACMKCYFRLQELGVMK